VVARHTRVYSLYCETCWQEKDTVELGSSRHRGVEFFQQCGDRLGSAIGTPRVMSIMCRKVLARPSGTGTSSMHDDNRSSACLKSRKINRYDVRAFFSFFPLFFLFSFFFFFFLYHIFVVKVQEIAWRASYGENKTQNAKRTNKGNIRNVTLLLGSVPVPGPNAGAKLKQVNQRTSSLNQRTA